MVLGLFKGRRKGGNPPAAGTTETRPMGEKTPEGYIPHPEELAKAEPLPQLLFEDTVLELLTEEELGWALLAKDEWKPKRPSHQKGSMLVEPVRLPGRKWPYDAIVWNGDKIYLVDALTFALLKDATGELTARELVEKTLTGFIEHLPEDDEIKIVFQTDPGELDEETKYWRDGIIAAFYAQLALLKKLGLLS